MQSKLMTRSFQLVRSWAHSVGLDVHRLVPTANPAYQLAQGLRRFGVDLVLDVGANSGDFAAELRSVGYKGQIISFEPLENAHAQLSRRAFADGMWQVHSRCAIGDRDGMATINVAANSVSSSLLSMTEAHSSAARGSDYVGTESVPIARLDSVGHAYIGNKHVPFLKIDTQGYEWAVLDGAPEALGQMRGLLCELSLVTLYEGQHLWRDVLERVEKAGFTLWALQSGFTDPRDGRTLQLDAIFFRV